MAAQAPVIDSSNSKVSFSLKKLGFLNIQGSVGNLEGSIIFDENNFEKSNFDVSVSAQTIDTKNAKRDEHLKNKDFFSAEEFPKIHFQSTEIRRLNNHFIAVGKLSLLHKTNEVSIPFTFENKTLKGDFSLQRLNFELGKKIPSFIVGNEIKVSIHAKLK
jgi:polyisoprenoid-binding protein YceI